MEYIGLKIGLELRSLRKEHGMTLEELGEKVNMSTSHINQIELGSRKMTMELLFKIMTLFDVDANTVLEISKKENKNQASIDAMLMDFPQDIKEDLIDSFQYTINKLSKQFRS